MKIPDVKHIGNEIVKKEYTGTEVSEVLKGLVVSENKDTQHPLVEIDKPCLGERDYWGEYDCGYDTDIICEDCACSGLGSIDPETGEDLLQ